MESHLAHADCTSIEPELLISLTKLQSLITKRTVETSVRAQLQFSSHPIVSLMV